MSFKSDVDKFQNSLNAKISADKVEKTIKLCCEQVRGTILKSMAETPRNSQVTYYSGVNRDIEHHPSLPGNPPAPDTGNLRASIHYTIDKSEKLAAGYVGTDVDYGKYLEYGTSRIAPRPWLKPALEKNKDFISKAFENILHKEA